MNKNENDDFDSTITTYASAMLLDLSLTAKLSQAMSTYHPIYRIDSLLFLPVLSPLSSFLSLSLSLYATLPLPLTLFHFLTLVCFLLTSMLKSSSNLSYLICVNSFDTDFSFNLPSISYCHLSYSVCCSNDIPVSGDTNMRNRCL